MEKNPIDNEGPFPSRSRRDVLAAGASVTGLAWLGGSARASAPQVRAGDNLQREGGYAKGDGLDAGLARLHERLPDANVHRSNHVAMVIEALSVLGHEEAIGPWLDENFGSYQPDGQGAGRLDVSAWRESLGRADQGLAWWGLFEAELADEDWRVVLARWAPRLAPGLAGAATHGVIRTGHAARSLVARDNPIRRRELVTGLAYWAATYQELPWDGSVAPESSVEAALARVEPRLPQREPPRGNIIAGLNALAETPSFTPVAGWVDTSDPGRTLNEMASAFAHVYLRNPNRRVHFTHSITAPSALRLLAPHLDEETVTRATRYAWQAAAGLFVVYHDPRLSPPEERAPAEREAIVARVVEQGAPHGIKLTEACLREVEFSRDPVLMQVAHDAAEALNG